MKEQDGVHHLNLKKLLKFHNKKKYYLFCYLLSKMEMTHKIVDQCKQYENNCVTTPEVYVDVLFKW